MELNAEMIEQWKAVAHHLEQSGAGEAVHVAEWITNMISNFKVDGEGSNEGLIDSLLELQAWTGQAISDLRKL